ncbi:MAG: TniQ family protein [Pyrinomonadaceae bacterium]
MSLQDLKNSLSGLTTFPVVRIETVPIPARNYLISLQPVGIGTNEVESLSSYISRLAREYYVSPNKLMESCVKRYFGVQAYLDNVGYNPNTFKNINGLDETARTVVSSIELATGRKDIAYMTLLPWRNILSSKQMRLKRAWCPSCLQSDLENGQPVYERLLWKIDIVENCPFHERKLVTLCPHCNASQANFSTYSFPGFCSNCKIWVGQEEKYQLKKQEDFFEKWLSLEIGKVLAASRKVKEDIRARVIFAHSLRSLMDKSPFISYAALRNKTGLATSTIKKLSYGEIALSFNILMKICCSFRCSPVDLLLGNEFSLVFRNKALKKK